MIASTPFAARDGAGNVVHTRFKGRKNVQAAEADFARKSPQSACPEEAQLDFAKRTRERLMRQGTGRVHAQSVLGRKPDHYRPGVRLLPEIGPIAREPGGGS
jgi:hypothetical protein